MHEASGLDVSHRDMPLSADDTQSSAVSPREGLADQLILECLSIADGHVVLSGVCDGTYEHRRTI